MTPQELEGYYMIVVPGRNGYSFGIHCTGIDEQEAIERALEYYDDPRDINYAFAEKMDENDFKAFKDSMIELDKVK